MKSNMFLKSLRCIHDCKHLLSRSIVTCNTEGLFPYKNVTILRSAHDLMKLLCRGAVFTWDDCDYFAGKELKKKEDKNEFSIRGKLVVSVKDGKFAVKNEC